MMKLITLENLGDGFDIDVTQNKIHVSTSSNIPASQFTDEEVAKLRLLMKTELNRVKEKNGVVILKDGEYTIYMLSTFFNAREPRIVKINNKVIKEDKERGINILLIDKETFNVVYDRTLDTYGVAGHYDFFLNKTKEIMNSPDYQNGKQFLIMTTWVNAVIDGSTEDYRTRLKEIFPRFMHFNPITTKAEGCFVFISDGFSMNNEVGFYPTNAQPNGKHQTGYSLEVNPRMPPQLNPIDTLPV